MISQWRVYGVITSETSARDLLTMGYSRSVTSQPGFRHWDERRAALSNRQLA